MATSVPLLEVSVEVWRRLLLHLQHQGGGARESGAFLLGSNSGGTRAATSFLPYEELQADALQEDYVHLSAPSFARLWDICRSRNLTVVADVHTHRFGPGQSLSDATNPMVALRGHVAIIVPNFAQGEVRPEDLGLYVYQGSHQWKAFRGREVAQHLTFASHGSET